MLIKAIFIALSKDNRNTFKINGDTTNQQKIVNLIYLQILITMKNFKPISYFYFFKLIITSLLVFNFFSCSRDDVNENDTKDDINQEEIDANLTEAEALLVLVNQSRASEGLSPLILNNALNAAALAHSKDMNENNYFEHEGLNGSRFWDRTADAGYTGSALGENIAKGQNSVQAVHNGWMESDGHRSNILNPNITEMGLGHDGIYWTQIFGRAK